MHSSASLSPADATRRHAEKQTRSQGFDAEGRSPIRAARVLGRACRSIPCEPAPARAPTLVERAQLCVAGCAVRVELVSLGVGRGGAALQGLGVVLHRLGVPAEKGGGGDGGERGAGRMPGALVRISGEGSCLRARPPSAALASKTRRHDHCAARCSSAPAPCVLPPAPSTHRCSLKAWVPFSFSSADKSRLM